MTNSINTAFIEDEETYANSLNHLISNWGKQNNIIFNVNHFVSGKTFFESHYLLFDLIFLDIELNDTNGLDIAKKLREQEYKGIIIFVTSHSEYVFEGYNVQAFNYLVKPFNKDNLFKTLASAVKLVEKKYYTFHTIILFYYIYLYDHVFIYYYNLYLIILVFYNIVLITSL